MADSKKEDYLLLKNFLLLQVAYDEEKNICYWTSITTLNGHAWAIGFYIVKTFLPCSFIIGTYTHVLIKLRQQDTTTGRLGNQTRRATYMAAVASTVLVIGVFPTETDFMLSKLGLRPADSNPQYALDLLLFLSGCLNPFFYGFINPIFRKAFKRLVYKNQEIAPNSSDTG